jgi:hypothetical protein
VVLVSAAVAARRAPLMALALVALFAGLWGGLLRMGINVHSGGTTLAEAHGPLMTLGFLGTLISLERAVALRRTWAYVAPFAAAIGALLALSGTPGGYGAALLLLAGAVLVAAHVAIDRVQRSLHNAIMGLGAVAWCAAAAWWLTGAAVARFVPLLAAFLVLTIVGERLELARMGGLGRVLPRLWLGGAVVALVAGLVISLPAHRLGVRIAGAGLIAQALWLARYDIARRTVRGHGVTRFMAIALLVGYVWLAVAGVLWIAGDPALAGGFAYDASLHAIFLGFVFSMVFAHAPVIVPAVLRVPLPYHRRFYAHLALLHGSLALRLLGGDLAGNLTSWQWGGGLGELAILLFIVSSAHAVLSARRGKRRPAKRSGQVTHVLRTPTPQRRPSHAPDRPRQF